MLHQLFLERSFADDHQFGILDLLANLGERPDQVLETLLLDQSAVRQDDRDIPEVELLSVQPHKDGLLAMVEGVTDRNAAEGLRGTSLLAPRRSLDPDEFWPEQLIGLDVVDTAGVQLGVVSNLAVGGAQDRLVVATECGDRDVPFVAALVTEVDVAGRRLVLEAPEGLLD